MRNYNDYDSENSDELFESGITEALHAVGRYSYYSDDFDGPPPELGWDITDADDE